MTNLVHYTINTGHTHNLRPKVIQPETRELLLPIAERAVLSGSISELLPKQCDGCSIKITAQAGSALFDIYDPERMMLTFNAVAWSSAKESELWGMTQSTYKEVSKSLGLPISTTEMPSSLPWLTTFTFPNPVIFSLPWFADFEQCLAIMLIEASKE
ncbi:hypothetical protein NDI45_28985 [Leptolyngbya sp. GB1-A1]|uniref:hypothetical protein n=1 Tax=Leptolyngbya sp. GB1-A1 TaxID=2933908 RepID=UPI003296D8C0